MKKINVARVSDEEVETLFTSEFDNRIARYNNFSEFEVKCRREVANDSITVEVMIVGQAGSPTIDDWKKGRVENSALVQIARDDIGGLNFHLVPEETTFLNSNDYYVYYKSV